MVELQSNQRQLAALHCRKFIVAEEAASSFGAGNASGADRQEDEEFSSPDLLKWPSANQPQVRKAAHSIYHQSVD